MTAPDGTVYASIVPPPFGGGYCHHALAGRPPDAGFNCAAPFRGRLLAKRIKKLAGVIRLQLCRPLSGAVTRR